MNKNLAPKVKSIEFRYGPNDSITDICVKGITTKNVASICSDLSVICGQQIIFLNQSRRNPGNHHFISKTESLYLDLSAHRIFQKQFPELFRKTRIIKDERAFKLQEIFFALMEVRVRDQRDLKNLHKTLADTRKTTLGSNPVDYATDNFSVVEQHKILSIRLETLKNRIKTQTHLINHLHKEGWCGHCEGPGCKELMLKEDIIDNLTLLCPECIEKYSD
ncbi:MAG: hypothetical protein ACKUBY_05225 [Candidatus Moraniibacteriota bacterium]|jgi:hypothetical protein